MNIKKFKNGNINLKLINTDWFYNGTTSYSFNIAIKMNFSKFLDIDKIYNNEITMNDLYFNQINGYNYLVDFNTQRAYDFSQCYRGALLDLKDMLMDSFNENQTLKLYPVSNKEYKSLMEDLENGY